MKAWQTLPFGRLGNFLLCTGKKPVPPGYVPASIKYLFLTSMGSATKASAAWTARSINASGIPWPVTKWKPTPRQASSNSPASPRNAVWPLPADGAAPPPTSRQRAAKSNVGISSSEARGTCDEELGAAQAAACACRARSFSSASKRGSSSASTPRFEPRAPPSSTAAVPSAPPATTASEASASAAAARRDAAPKRRCKAPAPRGALSERSEYSSNRPPARKRRCPSSPTPKSLSAASKQSKSFDGSSNLPPPANCAKYSSALLMRPIRTDACDARVGACSRTCTCAPVRSCRVGR
mmetsp:Transcript_79294/g.201830  ORF Transcript_79294/g.201830 Transcript_79294/m.201830 type:complete len:296 (+) Transcript_79294:693-1580(+)